MCVGLSVLCMCVFGICGCVGVWIYVRVCVFGVCFGVPVSLGTLVYVYWCV